MDNDAKTKRFFWGMVLEWIPSAPLIIGVFSSFRGISGQKATGLGAIAGGVSEVYLTFGVILTFLLLGDRWSCSVGRSPAPTQCAPHFRCSPSVGVQLYSRFWE